MSAATLHSLAIYVCLYPQATLRSPAVMKIGLFKPIAERRFQTSFTPDFNNKTTSVAATCTNT
jgi:hypothetical protein